MRMVVVLPAPFGPMNPNRSPRFKFKLIDLIANKSPYFFVKSRVSIIEKLSELVSAECRTLRMLRPFPTFYRQHKPIYYRGFILLVSDRRTRGLIDQADNRLR